MSYKIFMLFYLQIIEFHSSINNFVNKNTNAKNTNINQEEDKIGMFSIKVSCTPFISTGSAENIEGTNEISFIQEQFSLIPGS